MKRKDSSVAVVRWLFARPADFLALMSTPRRSVFAGR